MDSGFRKPIVSGWGDRINCALRVSAGAMCLASRPPTRFLIITTVG
jgi:hypothetical protein